MRTTPYLVWVEHRVLELSKQKCFRIVTYMAELYVASAIVGLGYLLSKKTTDKPTQVLASVPTKSQPNGDNIFNDNRVLETRLKEQDVADHLYKQAWSDPASNLVVPGPMEAYFKKVDQADKTLPIEYTETPDLTVIPPTDPNFATSQNYGYGHPTGNPVADGHYGISLSGEPIDPKNFTHNRMIPYFGAHIRQNLDEYVNNQIIESFTGQMKDGYMSKKKAEQKVLFDPENNIHNPYGMSNLSGYQRDRFVVSNIRNNEAPTEKIYVGPGINAGYTWQPSGGFQQEKTRDYTLPKTVDELRVKTNPKSTYHGRILPGAHISRPGKIGVVQKNRPDNFHEWGPERYFIGKAARDKPKQRPEVVMKYSNRTTTDIRSAVGPAAPTDGGQESLRANYRESDKPQYTPGGPRNVDASGSWTITEDFESSNYVPMVKPDDNCPPSLVNQQTIPVVQDSPYDDHRNNYCQKPHDYGRRAIVVKANNRKDTSCIPMANLRGYKQENYIPIVEKLRPSRKQTIIGNPRWASNVEGPQNRHPVWDPNDIPKTTIKETLLQEARKGNITNSMLHKPRVHDPSDVPRATQKEDVMLFSHSGEAYRPTDAGYEIAPTDMPTTHRETMETDYAGNPVGSEEGAYQILKINPKETNRQYTSVHEYTGNARGDDKPVMNDAMRNNATTRSYREVLAVGRTPAREGPKEIYNSDMVNATTNKVGPTQNVAISQRPLINTRIINSIPQANRAGETKAKTVLSNKRIRDRLDVGLLDPLRSNPYHLGLHNYVF